MQRGQVVRVEPQRPLRRPPQTHAKEHRPAEKVRLEQENRHPAIRQPYLTLQLPTQEEEHRNR